MKRKIIESTLSGSKLQYLLMSEIVKAPIYVVNLIKEEKKIIINNISLAVIHIIYPYQYISI